MKIKVKRPHTQTYKNGSIFFNFNTNVDFDTIDIEKVCKKMKKCLKKELKRQKKWKQMN